MTKRPLWCSLAATAIAFCAQSVAGAGSIHDITWTLGPNHPEFRKGGCLTAFAGKVVSVFGMRQPWGEMATTYVYDPGTDAWSRGPNGPIGQTYVQGTECGGAFYAIGGRSAPLGGVHRRCYRLDVKRGDHTWAELARLNEARGWAPSASVDGRIYVFGGAQGGHGPTLDSVEVLDTTDPGSSWEKGVSIPADSRGWSGAAAVRGKVYLLGGAHFFANKPVQGPDRKRLADLWCFDPNNARWEARQPLPYRLAGFDCCVYKDRFIIVVGGAPETDDFTNDMKRAWQADRFFKSYYSPFVLIYDTTTDQWRRMPSLLPMPTNDIRVVIVEDTLYALGGENIEPATSNTTPWLRMGHILDDPAR